MKCRWQIQKFKPYADKIICFIDEPILSAFGSSTYVSVKREDVVALIGEVVEAVHAEGAMAGVHCCGNTDWSILIDAGVDIINFDAFELRRNYRPVSGGGEQVYHRRRAASPGASCRPRGHPRADGLISGLAASTGWWTTWRTKAGIEQDAHPESVAHHPLVRHRLHGCRAMRRGCSTCAPRPLRTPA